MRVTFAFASALGLAVTIVASAGGPALAHPPPPPDGYDLDPPVLISPPVRIIPEPDGPKPHTALEAQIGGGLGRDAASNERWLGFSVGWHAVRRSTSWLRGNELGLDVDLRLGDARDGSSIIVGLRPIARRQDGDVRTASLFGLALPELAWSSGDGRQRALRVEWTCPIAISLGGRSGIEWDFVRAGAVFVDDGVHASFGTELRFLMR